MTILGVAVISAITVIIVTDIKCDGTKDTKEKHPVETKK